MFVPIYSEANQVGIKRKVKIQECRRTMGGVRRDGIWALLGEDDGTGSLSAGVSMCSSAAIRE